jgi:hypothetical protein
MEGFRFEFDASNKILRLSFLGDLTDRLLLEGYESARASWFRHGPFHFIADYSAVSDASVSAETVRAIASRHPVMPTNDYLGIIVAPQNVLYDLARTFEFLTTDTRRNIRVVHTMGEALQLIGVPSPTFSLIEFPEAA